MHLDVSNLCAYKIFALFLSTSTTVRVTNELLVSTAYYRIVAKRPQAPADRGELWDWNVSVAHQVHEPQIDFIDCALQLHAGGGHFPISMWLLISVGNSRTESSQSAFSSHAMPSIRYCRDQCQQEIFQVEENLFRSSSSIITFHRLRFLLIFFHFRATHILIAYLRLSHLLSFMEGYHKRV